MSAVFPSGRTGALPSPISKPCARIILRTASSFSQVLRQQGLLHWKRP